MSWLNSERYEKDPASVAELSGFDGIIVPGGFGKRGIEGKILAIKYCRENNIPYLGLCYGMQLAVIEFARNVANLKGAHTMEVNPLTGHPVIHTMDEQVDKIKNKDMGGSMRLGAYKCNLVAGTVAARAYGVGQIQERHRHRYEVNNSYREKLEKKGMVFSGINRQKNLVEIAELPGHPFFVGTQFHPEFKSRPLLPHPLFVAFIKASLKK